MRDPDDRVCMASFIQTSVAAGATGVGAGLEYMGPHAMHIRGGAPRIGVALYGYRQLPTEGWLGWRYSHALQARHRPDES